MNLTSTQYKVAEKVTRGKSQKEIADELCVSPHTIKNHIANICERTGARSSVDIARKFILSLENPRSYFTAIGFILIQFHIVLNCATLDLRKPVRNSSRTSRTSRKL